MFDRMKKLAGVAALVVLLTNSVGLAQPGQTGAPAREPATPREAWARVTDDLLAMSAAERERVVAAIEAARAEGTRRLSTTVEQIRAVLSQAACRAAGPDQRAGG